MLGLEGSWRRERISYRIGIVSRASAERPSGREGAGG